MNPISPMVLQAQITMPGAAGELGVADPTRLENPFQAPMWLDEIRFHIPYVVDPLASPNPAVIFPIYWSNLYVKLFLGEIPLTNGAVPLSLLCKQLNDSPIPGLNSVTPGVPVQTFEEGSPPQPVQYNVFTWKLPKPLFIPAREYLRPVIYYAPSPTTALPLLPVSVNIMYAVRPLPKGTPTPKKLQIPWVAAYVPSMMQNFDSVDPENEGLIDRTDLSTPSDLFNPFEQELHVQRFVGRFLNFRVGESATPEDTNRGDLFGVMTFVDELVDFNSNVPLAGTFVTAQDSQNNILIRDPTPFSHVFSAIDRSWTVNCVLPPKGFYLFSIDRNWEYLAGLTYTAAATVGIAMIGWRDVFYAPRG
jgi:hypothetical protein